MKFLIYPFFICFLIIPPIISNEVDIKCSDDFCKEYKGNGHCNNANDFCRKNPNSIHFLYPDTCNCCEYCLKSQEKDELCTLGQPGSAAPTKICGPGLQCIKTNEGSAKCQRIKNKCTEAQDAFDKRRSEGSLGMTEVRPQCDDDGFFKPYHCIPGSICYCLAPSGERIFGELPYLDYEDEANMTCGCSINAWKAQNTLDQKYEISVARCTEIGTYDELQCTMSPNASCLCVDSESGAPESGVRIVPEADIKENQPFCFDSARHVAGKYATECEAELERYFTYVAARERGDDNLLKVEKPLCQADGKFARIQKSGSKKICATPDGRQIDSYEAEVGTQEEKTMDCNCARTRWLLNNAGVVELPACCSNGNFEAWQCRRNECFCVNNNGEQLGSEANINEKSKLECYRSKQGKPC